VKPIAHGTDRGYNAEIRRGLLPCDACRDAHTVAARVWRTGTDKPRQLLPCPSDGAYYRHLRRGEVPCEPCLLAHSVAEVGRARRRRERAA